MALILLIQGRFFKAFISNPDAAKPSQALRINDMKGKLLIGKAKQDFNDGAAQHLLGTHALGSAALGLNFALVQVLQKIATDGRLVSMMSLISPALELWG